MVAKYIITDVLHLLLIIIVQAHTVEEFLSSPSAAKLQKLGDDPGKVLVEFLGVSV